MGWVGGPSGWSGTGRGTIGKVWDGLRDPPGSLRRVRGPTQKSETGWGPSVRSGTGRGTFGKVRDGSGDPPKVRDGPEDPRGDT